MESTELARLKPLIGRQTTRLTHYGRKTGKAYKVTIWFVLDSDRLYIGTANAKPILTIAARLQELGQADVIQPTRLRDHNHTPYVHAGLEFLQ